VRFDDGDTGPVTARTATALNDRLAAALTESPAAVVVCDYAAGTTVHPAVGS